ncbi:MAG TPA: hypothetical protein PLR50_12240, partial [Candidatus Rifleibacterium sp.]|nr:hypothetical protein [Candidatus Rifleibacterium sp.]
QFFKLPIIADLDDLAILVKLDMASAQHVTEIGHMLNEKAEPLNDRLKVKNHFSERFIALKHIKHAKPRLQ